MAILIPATRKKGKQAARLFEFEYVLLFHVHIHIPGALSHNGYHAELRTMVLELKDWDSQSLDHRCSWIVWVRSPPNWSAPPQHEQLRRLWCCPTSLQFYLSWLRTACVWKDWSACTVMWKQVVGLVWMRAPSTTDLPLLSTPEALQTGILNHRWPNSWPW